METKPKRKPALVEVEVIRKIGLTNEKMANPGDIVKIKRADAITLQNVGAVKVII